MAGFKWNNFFALHIRINNQQIPAKLQKPYFNFPLKLVVIFMTLFPKTRNKISTYNIFHSK